LLAVRENVLSDLTVPEDSQFVDKVTETIAGNVETLEMLVRVLDSFVWGLVLRKGKLLLARV
jgi:hypothetical protein